MSTISLRLPPSLHKAARELADKENISLNLLITLALAEKLSALMTEDYINERAKQYDKAKFEAALAEIPDVEPEDYDAL